MAALLGEAFGLTNPSVDNTAALQAAINAAAEQNTKVILPAGEWKFSQDLILPPGYVGACAIEGLGKKITKLVAVNGSNGFNFDLSAGTAANNSVDISNLGIMSWGIPCKTPISLSYGTGTLGSVENQPGSSIKNVAIYGGAWANGISLRNCWHATLDDVYMCGNAGAYTTNSGIGLVMANCFNSHFDKITMEFFTQGLVLNNNGLATPGFCQGLFFDILNMVECVEGIHAYGTPNNYFSTLMIQNLMIDNGNINVAGHRGVILENMVACEIIGGQALQNGGDANVILNNCARCKVIGLSLEYRANTTGPCVWLEGTTNSCDVSRNTIGGTVQLDAGTANNRIDQFQDTIVNNGHSNTINGVTVA